MTRSHRLAVLLHRGATAVTHRGQRSSSIQVAPHILPTPMAPGRHPGGIRAIQDHLEAPRRQFKGGLFPGLRQCPPRRPTRQMCRCTEHDGDLVCAAVQPPPRCEGQASIGSQGRIRHLGSTTADKGTVRFFRKHGLPPSYTGAPRGPGYDPEKGSGEFHRVASETFIEQVARHCTVR